MKCEILVQNPHLTDSKLRIFEAIKGESVNRVFQTDNDYVFSSRVKISRERLRQIILELDKEGIIKKLKYTKSNLLKGDKDYEKANHLRRKYGLTLKDYYEMYEKQDYKCAVCNKFIEESKFVHVDHCHISGKIRGLLCLNCNIGIGNFRNDISILGKAIEYLNKNQ